MFVYISHLFFFFVGSRDNISAVVVRLPGAVLGPASNGGVARLREQRLNGRDNGHGQTG